MKPMVLLPAPRQRAVVCLAVAVLLGHAVLLGLLPRSAGPGWRDEPVRVLHVRRLASGAAADLPSTGRPVETDAAAADPRVRARAAAAGVSARATAVPATRSSPHKAVAANVLEASGRPDANAEAASNLAAGAAGLVSAGADAGAGASLSAGAGANTDASANTDATAGADPSGTALAPTPALQPSHGGITVPVYATRLPPPLTLLYDMRRGGQRGSAELRWSPAGSSYQLQLQGRLTGGRGPGLAWASEGTLDADGIAPERHTESRRGRALRAVNFQRGSGRITFSGPQTEAALLPGTQDRLSWMLQLAGVLAANPALAAPGAQVLLHVAGTRGDAEVWAFDVLGTDTLTLADGSAAPALHLQRLPRRPYDTVVDIWLDPARHHLPVRTRLLLRPDGVDAGGTEFVLRGVQSQLQSP